MSFVRTFLSGCSIERLDECELCVLKQLEEARHGLSYGIVPEFDCGGWGLVKTTKNPTQTIRPRFERLTSWV